MALNNPAFNNPAFQDPRAVKTYPGGPQAANIGGQTQYAATQQAGDERRGQRAARGHVRRPQRRRHRDRPDDGRRHRLEDRRPLRRPPRHRRRRLDLDDVRGHAAEPDPEPDPVDRRHARRLRPLARRDLHVAQEDPPGADLRLRGLRGPVRRRHLGVLRDASGRASSCRRRSGRSRSSASPSPCSRAARSAPRSGPPRSSWSR